jgi:hypothetical protein
MNKTEYQAFDTCFRSIFDRYAGQLSNEGREDVQHYIDAAEIEMACESFILFLLEEQVQMPVAVKKELWDLALGLQLDKESVFAADFWKIASPFLRDQW